MSPRKLGRKGSALILVMIFAAMMAAIVPTMMSLYQSNSKNVSQARDLLVMRVIYDTIERYSQSPATLYRALYYSTYQDGTIPGSPAIATGDGGNWLSTTPVNSCLRGCMGGVLTSASGANTANCTSVSYPSGASLNTAMCESRDSSNNNPLWFGITLFHPTESDMPLSGPDPHPSAYPSSRPVRYMLDGTLCDGSTPESICPIEALSYFHPICSGDVWLDSSVYNMTKLKSPNVTFPSKSEMWIKYLIPIQEAHAHSARTCSYCMPLDAIGTAPAATTPSSPWTACPNNAYIAYDANAGATNYAMSKCCYGYPCTSVMTAALTSTEYTGGTGSYVKMCTMADSIMVWHKVQWNQSSSWALTSNWFWRGRWGRYRTLDSSLDAVGSSRNVSDIQQTKVCAKIFRKNFIPPRGTGICTE